MTKMPAPDKLITIADALYDRRLLGAALPKDMSSFAVWISVLKAAFALPLTKDERKLFASVSGGRHPPVQRVNELWAVVARRAGKSRMAAAIAVYLACFVDWSGVLAPGEIGYVLSVSPTLAQARIILSYVQAYFEASPVLRRKLHEVTQTELRLSNNIVVSVHPASFRSTRGRTLCAGILDEAAQLRDEVSSNPDIELYRSLLPSLATTHGMLIGISSPYSKRGLLFQKHQESFGNDEEDVLVVQGASTTFNPTLDPRVVARARKNDPESAIAEWDGDFRDDISGLFTDQLVNDAINKDRPLELAKLNSYGYFCFLDASAGRHDAFTCCIGHREGNVTNGKFVADVVRWRKPPFVPQDVALGYAALAKSYGCSKIIGDAFSGEWLASAVRAGGIGYETSEAPKSKLYLESLPHFARGAVSIPNIPLLTRELKLLERRLSHSGRETVDHPSYGGSDDLANAVCGCIYLAMKRGGYDITKLTGIPMTGNYVT